MKLKVIGWTEYDDVSLREGVCGWAAIHAITDEILEKGYAFSGEDHQEHVRCAPVMNDGKIRRMSQRGWGRLMADAFGHRGIYDYSPYSFGRNTSDAYPPKEAQYTLSVMPSENEELLKEILGEDYNPDFFVFGEPPEILTPEQLRERIYLKDATSEQLASFLKTRKLIMRDRDELRYLDEGDIITLCLDNAEFSFIVTAVSRERDFTKKEQRLVDSARYSCDENKKKLANELFEKTPDRIIIEGDFSVTDSWPDPCPTENASEEALTDGEGGAEPSEQSESELLKLVHKFAKENSDDEDDLWDESPSDDPLDNLPTDSGDSAPLDNLPTDSDLSAPLSVDGEIPMPENYMPGDLLDRIIAGDVDLSDLLDAQDYLDILKEIEKLDTEEPKDAEKSEGEPTSGEYFIDPRNGIHCRGGRIEPISSELISKLSDLELFEDEPISSEALSELSDLELFEEESQNSLSEEINAIASSRRGTAKSTPADDEPPLFDSAEIVSLLADELSDGDSEDSDEE